MTPDNSDTYNKLKKEYLSLDKFEKYLCQLLSIMYKDFSVTDIIKCLKGLMDFNVTDYHIMLSLRGLRRRDFLQADHECVDEFIEQAARFAVEDGNFDKMARVVRSVLPIDSMYTLKSSVLFNRVIREIRVGIYNADYNHVNHYTNLAYRVFSPKSMCYINLYEKAFNQPFDVQWFKSMPYAIQQLAIGEIVAESLIYLKPVDGVIDLLLEYENTGILYQYEPFYVSLSVFLVFQGKFSRAREIIMKHPNSRAGYSLMGIIYFFEDKNDLAIDEFNRGLLVLREEVGRMKIFLPGFSGVFYIMALFNKGDKAGIKHLWKTYSEYIDVSNVGSFFSIYTNLRHILAFLDNKKITTHNLFKELYAKSVNIFFLVFAHVLIDGVETAHSYDSALAGAYHRAMEHGYKLLAMEFLGLACYIKENILVEKRLEALENNLGLQCMVKRLTIVKKPWEHALNNIINLVNDNKAKEVQTDTRLVWIFTKTSKFCVFTPKEQKLLGSGSWSKGRNIALKRLHKNANELKCLTEQDRIICSFIKLSPSYYYSSQDYFLNWEDALIAMIGHPLVFLEESMETNVEFVEGKPEIIVEKAGDFFCLKHRADMEGKQVLLIKESNFRYKIVKLTDRYKTIISTLGSDGLKVPAGAKDKVIDALGALSSFVTVHSQLDANIAKAEGVEADHRPVVQLKPFGEGLSIEILVRPFREFGPYLKPAHDGLQLIVEHEGKSYQTLRDFDREREGAENIENNCSSLHQMDAGSYTWTSNEPVDCLNFLMELKEMEEEVTVLWPEGERFKVSREMSFDRLRLKVKSQGDWFSVQGELQVDEKKVVSLMEILNNIDGNDKKFVKLDDENYLALSESLKKRLEELKAFTKKQAKKTLQLHPLSSFALDGLFGQAGFFEADSKWQEHIDKINEAFKITPEVPSTLQIQLRDYQVEGYEWLSRIAYMGFGACLADDMGLGKTIQGLAAILARAKEGASLVVAPTSVTTNWINETTLYAPTLKIINYRGKTRQELLKKLQPFDLVVCSYGLLQSDDELLGEVHWSTIILDEAQAIKNFATKRSQAAMNLQGGFKMITTGTPVENNMGELWNLFNFINPELLGSIKKFNDNFAVPIQKDNDKNAKGRLKKLIQPFILRRLKSQVLEELPPRTEIVLYVDMAEEEREFYEAIRQNALKKINALDSKAGQKRIQILAELMKLRRACCNCQLVNKKIKIQSSKLAMFNEIVRELIDNRHKALVFSQFVDHLGIIKNELDTGSIKYQYLDGKTPLKSRNKAVNDFQGGVGDLFLISIKAGGFGLNLTASDYVIHMDPWWNPAVEDQASDRAHRIGQTRPVTIYKLITRNTIEEKIVELHKHKKQLAQSLIDDCDNASRLTEDDLIALIMNK